MGCETGKDKFNDLRRRAQDFLALQSEVITKPSEKLKTLVHELNTYQIELELQNEDLRQAQIELEQSRQRYIDLFDFAPVGYLTVSDKGIILEANLTASSLLGVERSALLKQPLSRFIHPEDQDIYYLYRREELATDAPPHAYRLRLLRPDATSLLVTLHTSSHDADGTPVSKIALSDSSALKLNEDELSRNQEFLQKVIESIPHSFMVIDASDYTIKQANSAASAGAIGRATTCHALSHKRDKPCEGAEHLCPLEEIRKTKKSVTTEHRHYDENGNPRNVEVQGAPIFDAQGNVTHIIEYCLDITARKIIEDTQAFLLRPNYPGSERNSFEAIAQYLSDTMGMEYVCIDRLLGDELRAQTVAVYFNGVFEENVVYTLKDTPCGEVVGKEICCFPKDVRQLFPRDVVLQEMMAESYVGTTLWGVDGKPIGLIAVIGLKPLENRRRAEAVLQLVAVRVASELERTQAEEAVKASIEQFQLILNSTAEAIYGLDSDGNCTFCNESCTKMLGYEDQQDLLGRNMHDLIHHTMPDGTPHKNEECRIYKAFRQNRGVHVEDEVFWHRDGTCFPVEYWSYPMMRGDTVIGGVVTFVDVSERKKMEEAMRQKMDELQRFSKMAVGREKKMIKLKGEVNSLMGELGRKAKYKIVK